MILFMVSTKLFFPHLKHNLKICFYVDLRHFLQLAAKNSAIVGQYISSGGKTLELVQSLERIDKNDPSQITHVFNGIQLTLIEVLSNATQFTQPTIQACSYLINSHRECIEKLLNSYLVSQKKSVLKLLTAIVALDPQFGRDILNTFNVVFNAETLQRFTKHSKNEIQRNELETVRMCYIHFLMAYLIEGNSMLIRNLLDRNELVMAILSGLIYDNAETVCLVLSTFKRFVLMSSHVTKTKKIQIFNSDIVRELMHLYEWKGPQYFVAMLGRQTKDKAETFVNADELNTVADSVNEFMTVLLASRKYGIAFQCLGFRRTKTNNIQKRILFDLTQPYIDDRRAKLSIEIIKACPELARSFLKNIASALDPNNKRHNWFKAIVYFSDLLSELSPSIIRSGIENMSVKETIQVVEAICLSPEILQNLRSRFTLRNDNVYIRYRSTKLLYIMLKQSSQYLHQIGTWAVYSDSDMKKIKFDFINHIFVHCPPVENILASLHMTLQNNTDDQANIFSHLEYVLDLLLIISKSIPSFIDETSSLINYMNILRPIYEMNREHESITRIELKAVKLILELEPKSLSRETEFFAQVMQSFLNVLVFGSLDEQHEAKQLLRNVFINTGIFENGILEVDIWLDAFKQIDVNTQNDVQKFVVDTIVSFSIKDEEENNLEQIATESTTITESNRNIIELFNKIESGIALSGNVNVLIIGQFFRHFVTTFNDTGAPQTILPYLDAVGLALFHFLPEPKAVYMCLNAKHHQHTKLMKNWIKYRRPGVLVNHSSNLFQTFYNEIFSNDQTDLIKSFRATESEPGMKLTVDGKDCEFDTILANDAFVMQLIYVLIFAVQHWTNENEFDQAKICVSSKNLKSLIDIIQQLSNLQSFTNAELGFEEETTMTSFKNALRFIFAGRLLLLNNFDIWTNTSITQLTFELMMHTRQYSETEQLDMELFEHFRAKTINRIALVEKNSLPPKNIDNNLKTLHLNSDQCQCIINSIILLWKQIDCKDVAKQIELKAAYNGILSICLNRIAELRESPLKCESIQNLFKLYVNDLKLHANVQIDVLENALHAYLSIFCQSFGDISEKCFEEIALCQTDNFTKTTIRLATLLLERNLNVIEIFVQLLSSNQLLDKKVLCKETIYPLLNVIVWRNPVISTIALTKLYDEFKQGILRTIEKPLKAGVIYRENIYSSVWLIERCMPLNHCIDFTRKTLKFDGTDVYQLQIIKAIHTKALNADALEIQQQVYVNFLSILVQLLVMLLKKDDIDYEKVTAYSVIAAEWMTLKHKLCLPSMEKIRSSSSWILFGRSCLKYGIQMPYDDETKKYNNQSAILLKLMGFLCDHIYPDEIESKDAGTFFEMTISHSEFLPIALIHSSNDVKTYLMYILYVLAKKNQSNFKSTHIPILLSAYQAKLSTCDRYILALLQLYERNGINMSEYKPFIWGESAISYYSLKGSSANVNLVQEPPMMQAISLIDRDTADYSLTKFPVWRKIDAVSQVPAVEFIGHGIAGNQYNEGVSNASNLLEKMVEQHKFDSELQLLSSHKDNAYDDVYDPAFYIPLMSMAFGPDTFTRPVRPAQNGLLAMCFAGLSSQDKGMRLAAANVLIRYRNHLETSRFIDNKVWAHLYDSIQRGLRDLTAEMRRHKKSRIPRVPYVAGLFLARTVNILSMPLSEMYRPLSSFILLKNKFDFLTVPEFNVLFQSPDVNHVIHRHFILDVICDGLKCGSDFTILMSMNIFKALLGYYDSSMTTRDTNLLILTVINAAVKIPKSASIMVDNIGIIPWISGTIDNTDFFQFDFIDGICSIINNLWYSMKFNSFKTNENIDEIEQRLLYSLLKLGDKLSSRITQISFGKYLNILMRITTRGKNRTQFISEKLLDHLIGLAKVHIKCDIAHIDHKQGSVIYWESSFAFVGRLRNNGTDEKCIFIAAAIREIIVKWLGTKENCV